MLEEIEKCDLVCANCHRIRTFTRKPLKHLELPVFPLNGIEGRNAGSENISV
jgi:hypothetical protein